MSLNNYPAGVTGNEFAIAGYDHEEDETRECRGECKDEREGTTYGFQGQMTWECSTCGWTEEWDVADEIDWDMLAEASREMREEREYWND